MAQTVFKRYEVKFLITREQKEKILNSLTEKIKIDSYGHSLIKNLYFDTDDFLLIRRSIEKPKYKEKLRVRTYGNDSEHVFVEMKKKYSGVVYKRRIALKEPNAIAWLCERKPCPNTQIAKEIDYSLNFYKTLKPKIFLSYEREAYYSEENRDFRLTFDENIIFRDYDLSFKNYGEPLLDENEILMEVKCSGAMPLWFTKVLSENKIYKTSFSKYGTVYTKHILKKHILKENNYAGTF